MEKTMSNHAVFYLSSDDMPMGSRINGIYIQDTKGRRRIDTYSGATTYNTERDHPAINAA
jgi:acetylornithine/succinyldiaminopimelate/putrescine aminotransferase